ncbi:uncharacterized protein G2W53_010428 [Senna tora]|uniref:Uncharacterized protein n=1 Tax=Senna tora TaxID=362788 RepID=A0A834WZW2_9FABA|nr:uncharacterized protein G2W53_010428 [Senna tora]
MWVQADHMLWEDAKAIRVEQMAQYVSHQNISMIKEFYIEARVKRTMKPVVKRSPNLYPWGEIVCTLCRQGGWEGTYINKTNLTVRVKNWVYFASEHILPLSQEVQDACLPTPTPSRRSDRGAGTSGSALARRARTRERPGPTRVEALLQEMNQRMLRMEQVQQDLIQEQRQAHRERNSLKRKIWLQAKKFFTRHRRGSSSGGGAA